MSDYRNDTRRGFSGFRKPEEISGEKLEAALSRIDTRNRYIFWTGNGYNARRLSLRSNSLKALNVTKVPVPLGDFLRLAARAVSDTEGYDPKAVADGLYLHRNSKPAVYFELRRAPDGSYVSSNNVPNADPTLFPKGLKEGDTVIPANEATDPAAIVVAGGTALVEAPETIVKRIGTKGKGGRK
jgi:hypothetical protein